MIDEGFDSFTDKGGSFGSGILNNAITEMVQNNFNGPTTIIQIVVEFSPKQEPGATPDVSTVKQAKNKFDVEKWKYFLDVAKWAWPIIIPFVLGLLGHNTS